MQKTTRAPFIVAVLIFQTPSNISRPFLLFLSSSHKFSLESQKKATICVENVIFLFFQVEKLDEKKETCGLLVIDYKNKWCKTTLSLAGERVVNNRNCLLSSINIDNCSRFFCFPYFFFLIERETKKNNCTNQNGYTL